ncbi:MAG: DUF1150 family protein [Parvibaculaceae bacterium]|nr:DUF1150 family protein [Parvibaculaceae bacterium]|tara:strand:- start:205 stop:495 length:291 start_codon:yes stop_codon:yes gene_type:complete
MLNANKENTEPVLSRAEMLHMTDDALAELGLNTHVYVRAMQARDLEADIGGQIEVAPDTWLYAVHAANGARLAIVDSREGAFQGARAYGYEPLSVH